MRLNNEKVDDGNVIVKSGVSFAGLLGIVFIVLKLCHVIDWSWWLVLLPLYVVPAAFLLAALMLIIIILILKR